MVQMPAPLDLVLLAAALWRMCAMLVYERGPRDVFVHLREYAGIAHDDEGAPIARLTDSWLSGVLFCTWCLSVNLALPLVGLWLLAPDLARILCLPLALSAGAIAIERCTHGTS